MPFWFRPNHQKQSLRRIPDEPSTNGATAVRSRMVAFVSLQPTKLAAAGTEIEEAQTD
jgi:hypothetical protein